VPLLLYGALCFCAGIGMYLAGVLLVFPRYLLGLQAELTPLSEWLVWYSGVPIVAGIGFALVDLLLIFERKRPRAPVRFEPLADCAVTVALTAYNDEASIGAAVRDFLGHPLVRRVIVVSNNSGDATIAEAEAAGAIAHDEPAQGYGQCVYRCLREAALFDDTELIVLCEGDRTFRAYDLEKLTAYVPHADIVNGTRTVERLREPVTQLSTFMFYGNIFVGKLLEAKHLGRGTITDVGTTYKVCRRAAVLDLLPRLNPAINLEFNAHFLDVALDSGALLIECPITFHARVGVSKGGNTHNWRALTVGLAMIRGLTFGWPRAT
jgi:glycosyltransferase involved in cell wall biosynthesis